MACIGRSSGSCVPKTLLRKLSGFSRLAVLFFFAFTSLSAQEKIVDYRKIFGRDYERAVFYLQTEKWIDSLILKNGLQPIEVRAIVFPELIRYNSIQDKIETFALETLYVQYGKAYANFSIGPFQIKPSFAEQIELDFLNKIGNSLSGFSIVASDTVQSELSRANRVKRLKSKTWMMNYINVFFKLMSAKYPTWKSEEEKIKFFSSAYNCGYRKSKEEIMSFSKKKFFQTGFGTRTKYNYSEIALFYFQNEN